METVHVPLGKRAYDVLIDFDFLSDLGETLRHRGIARDNAAVMTSPTIGAYYYGIVEESLRRAHFGHVGRLDIPDGEENKNLDNWARAVRWLAHFAPDPSIEPVVVTLGGGVIGDLAGFAAACFRRGVPYVQVPTTLLAAVDSSVGGKTAVDLPEGKNLVGAICQPRLVYADMATFRTLPERQVRSGLAEVIKYGVALDADLFLFLEHSIEDVAALNPAALLRVVPACVQLKADVVARDELDREHVRICLNFGHTLGHAIEMAAGGRLLHGECVAMGMIAAAHMSVRCGLCPPEVPSRIEQLIVRAGFPTCVQGVGLDDVLSFMAHDKKFVSGRNRFVLLADIGQWVEREGVPLDIVREAASIVLR